jgi:hypothetical protein
LVSLTFEVNRARWGAAFALLGIGCMAQAGLIFNPHNGDSLFDGDADDNTVTRFLDEDYFLFDAPFASVDVSTNGNLNFNDNVNFQNEGFPSEFAGGMIAPLWDDYIMAPGSDVLEHDGVGFYAFTWKNMASWRDSNSRHTFQAVLFATDQNFGGFNFLSRDIAFAYRSNGKGPNDEDATVGLNAFGGGLAAGLPGDGQTLLTGTDFGRLPLGPNEFILFRWNGEGYNVSLQKTVTVVPEPGTLAALGLGAAWLVARRSRKK